VKTLIWLFILTVTIFDVLFLWRCQQSAVDWESNPLALLAYR
jgi:hypothetical protein